ncbi:hypothetical protein DICPUDRAFT_147272 [Dictyostelium purpureum]|uniref:Uncharacterized protein n=1 Tax=Dictyostelium purpureum TaxID=5786 RepID=F0Z830_DICPU|nr:uncharacterized protein DICPUDRAFT_147272 [Dictyostelium purpureum]EGC39919.1 hypothetical protein DICPUDRAFT_147272 [Dictyostelium purpureum]|eukprot:XP_003283548.1 hypothetical protein DICPUDRAFT_147272 [Dictyostelium purpureum]
MLNKELKPINGPCNNGDTDGKGKTRAITKIITKTVNNTSEINALKAGVEKFFKVVNVKMISERELKKEEDSPDVAEAILEAALANTRTTSTLVGAATLSQRERVEKVRTKDGDPIPSQHKHTNAAKSVQNTTNFY